MADPATLPAAQEIPDLKWHLTDGKAEVLYNLHILVEVEDEQGAKTEQESVCNLRADATLEGLVGGPDMVEPPSTK
jgi:hypothetical protein